MKALSAVMGAPILPRGKSNLDEVAYYVKRAGFRSFVVVYSWRKAPSALKFYRLTDKGFFMQFGVLVLEEVILHRRPGTFIGFLLDREGHGRSTIEVWRFIRELFDGDSCEGFSGRKCRLIITDRDSGANIEVYGDGKIMDIFVGRVIWSMKRQ